MPRRTLGERKGGGGGWDPKVCVPKLARSHFPDCKSHFFPRWSLSLGGGGGAPPLLSCLVQQGNQTRVSRDCWLCGLSLCLPCSPTSCPRLPSRPNLVTEPILNLVSQFKVFTYAARNVPEFGLCSGVQWRNQFTDQRVMAVLSAVPMEGNPRLGIFIPPATPSQAPAPPPPPRPRTAGLRCAAPAGPCHHGVLAPECPAKNSA